MLAKFIHYALVRGWQTYLGPQSDTLFADLFGGIYDMTPKEVAGIAEFFRRSPPKLSLAWPRDEITARPACYVYSAVESQPGFALSDFGGAGGAPVTPAAQGYTPGNFLVPAPGSANNGTPGAAFVLSSLWTHQFQVMTLARGGPDPVMWATETNKSILLAAKNYFLSKAMQSVTLAAGEVTFREDLAPSDLFARTITLQCGREFSQADTSQALQEAFSLEGLVGEPGSDTHPMGRPTSHVQVQAPLRRSEAVSPAMGWADAPPN